MKPLTIEHKEKLIKRVEHLINCIEGLNTSKSDDIICAMGVGVWSLNETIKKIEKKIS